MLTVPLVIFLVFKMYWTINKGLKQNILLPIQIGISLMDNYQNIKFNFFSQILNKKNNCSISTFIPSNAPGVCKESTKTKKMKICVIF